MDNLDSVLTKRNVAKKPSEQQTPIPPQPSALTFFGAQVCPRESEQTFVGSTAQHSALVPSQAVAVRTVKAAEQQDWQQELLRYRPLIDYFAKNPIGLYYFDGKIFDVYQAIKNIQGILQTLESSTVEPEASTALYQQYRAAVNTIKSLVTINLFREVELPVQLIFLLHLDQAGLMEWQLGNLSLPDIIGIFKKTINAKIPDDSQHQLTQTIEKHYITAGYPGAPSRLQALILAPQILFYAALNPVVGRWWQDKCTDLKWAWQEVVTEIIEAIKLFDKAFDLPCWAAKIRSIDRDNDLFLCLFQKITHKLATPFLDSGFITRCLGKDWKGINLFHPKAKEHFGFDFISSFAFLLVYAPELVKKHVPAPMLNGICEALVAHAAPCPLCGLSYQQLIAKLLGLGADIEDPRGIVSHWLTQEWFFFPISLAIELVPREILSRLNLAARLSGESGQQSSPLLIWLTSEMVRPTSLAYLLPDMTNTALSKTLVALYQKLSELPPESHSTSLLRNFGNIWCSISTSQQHSAAKAIHVTKILSLPEQQLPVFRILMTIFANGNIDLAAGQRAAYTEFQHISGYSGKHLLDFFEQLVALAIPELPQFLLRQCLYQPALVQRLKHFFPTCIPYHHCHTDQQWHPFSELLVGAFRQRPRFSPDLGPGFVASIEKFVSRQKQTLTVDNRYLKLMPAADQASKVYGRTILFSPASHSQRVYRLKLRKKGEQPEQFLREMPALQYLRQQKSNKQLPLESQLPVPVEVFYLPHFSQWLGRSGLSPEQRSELNDQVQTDTHDNVLAYLYYTEGAEELYEHYVHERDPSRGYDLSKALDSLKTAAADMGRLWHRGICFDNAIPLYHENDDMKKSWQLITAPSPCGCIADWDAEATDYPNIAPLPSILRDFGDIHSFDEFSSQYKAMNYRKMGESTINTIARMLQALELLLAKTMQPEIRQAAQNPDSDCAKKSIQLIETSLKEPYCNFTREAFNTAVADQFLAKITTSPGPGQPTIVEQAARELTYFMEIGANPRYVQDMIEQRLCPIYPQLNTPLPPPKFLTPEGVKCVSNQRGVELLGQEYPMPLVQCTHMKYLAMSIEAALGLDGNAGVLITTHVQPKIVKQLFSK